MSLEGPIAPRRPEIHQTIKKENSDHLLFHGKRAEVLKSSYKVYKEDKRY